MTPRAIIVGGGPTGLMAAEVLAGAGLSVTLCEAMPTIGRKLLMAGKSGLNLTHAGGVRDILPAYGGAAPWLGPMLDAFGPGDIVDWAEGLGQQMFTGSTGRVFPVAMKASPLLRAWLTRLSGLGVDLRTRWRWTGWTVDGLGFVTPDGPRTLAADVTVLALGGASWARLGSNGAWAATLADQGIAVAPFQPANAALSVRWSAHMGPVLGQPVKDVLWTAGPATSRGEAVVSKRGLEGGGIYAISRAVREGAPLRVDLAPGLDAPALAARLSGVGPKASLSARLRKGLRWPAAKRALLQEFGRPLPTGATALAHLIKSLPVRHNGLRPLDEAISTAGGVAATALDPHLMLTQRPGSFCAGEMLDWEAPTGGYLLTGCLTTGRWAGLSAVAYAEGLPT
ncbi:MAG: TIGR03862 family flavoprotein [Marinibacterium sp.]